MNGNQGNGNNDNGNGNNNNGGPSNWTWMGMAAGALGFIGALGGITYAATRRPEQMQENLPPSHSQRPQRKAKNIETEINNQSEQRPASQYLSNLIDILSVGSNSRISRNPPADPVINNLNSLLEDIYVRFIALKDSDFELYYGVFHNVLMNLHSKMKEADPYYARYSSAVKFAGSHFDGLRIDKPDEFDMDIVIRLPLNMSACPINPLESDIVIEPKASGFVQLKMGVQYQLLPYRDGAAWHINKPAFEWKDDKNYLLQSKFIDWFKSVVMRALKTYPIGMNGRRLHYVNGIPYVIRTSESGPAVTLIIENASRGFRCDVDLVPAIQFPESRWPVSRAYRSIPPHCRRGHWMVVPKTNKLAVNKQERDRSWRLALLEQERVLMYDSNNLRQAIRLIKKLRDSQGMNAIASYYIKSLFYLEIIERNDQAFWSRNNPATLFRIMLDKFNCALISGNLPFFWNKDNNLLEQIPRSTLNEYARKVSKVIETLNEPSKYKMVAKYLLKPDEFASYNRQFLHI